MKNLVKEIDFEDCIVLRDRLGDLIGIYRSVEDAADDNGDDSEAVYNAIMLNEMIGDKKYSRETLFFWRLSAPKQSDGRLYTPTSVRGSHKHLKASLAVVQIDPKGNYVKQKFHSAYDASKSTGVDCANIIKCCKGKLKSVNGYYWMYAEEYDNTGGI